MAAVSSRFNKIQHIVVLMLENRSFDHLVGHLKQTTPGIVGANDGASPNYPEPSNPEGQGYGVSQGALSVMPFDPPHEFHDVQVQIYGRTPDPASLPPVTMNGFINSVLNPYDKTQRASDAVGASEVMKGFTPDNLTVLPLLANQFATFNYWFSSLPGPTWPNRMFVHAATSGGLTRSPSTAETIARLTADQYSFKKGTIYKRFDEHDPPITWRIYHEDIPQAAAISGLFSDYNSQSDSHFKHMKFFESDLNDPHNPYPSYVFIEPMYYASLRDMICGNYSGGNSMHPKDDIEAGEKLVKRVYDGITASPIWESTMLIITFDEHGGFFDHVYPPSYGKGCNLPCPPDNDYTYGDTYVDSNKKRQPVFDFSRFGVRVPAIVVSAYTKPGTIIGNPKPGDPNDAPNDDTQIFDHTSILATAEEIFGMQPLTARDGAANKLDRAINLENARSNQTEIPKLPSFPTLNLVQRTYRALKTKAIELVKREELTPNDASFLGLALACHLKTLPTSKHRSTIIRINTISTKRAASKYIRKIGRKISAARITK